MSRRPKPWSFTLESTFITGRSGPATITLGGRLAPDSAGMTKQARRVYCRLSVEQTEALIDQLRGRLLAIKEGA